MSRRSFLALSAASAVGVWAGRVIAGPFEAGDDDGNEAPVDKKLSAAWLKSLVERGTPDVFEGAELKTIGMPIGGIACGQLYLGGDGHLWKWEIFKADGAYDVNGSNYSRPSSSVSAIKQGFAVSIKVGDKTSVHPLREGGFAKVTFRGEYPVGRISYSDSRIPLSVALEAYTPYIPLNLEDSSYPATVFSYRLKNTGSGDIEVTLAGWLANTVCPGARATEGISRIFEVCRGKGCLSVSGRAETSKKRGDDGTIALNLVEGDGVSSGVADAGPVDDVADVFARLSANETAAKASKPVGQTLVGALGRTLVLKPGQEKDVTFILSWHFSSYAGFQMGLKDRGEGKRYYATRFGQATEVAEHIAANLERLHDDTMLWNKTWYDSTLPYWFLDRTFLTLNTLATQTVHRFDSGRFWAWEGTNCCPGTCQHVWHYAQGPARLFPAFERDIRERVDFGVAWRPDGSMAYRGENDAAVFIDGFCGTILRAYREHQMSADDAYLKRIWPRVKTSIEFSMKQPGADQGLLTGSQFNTLDSEWAGPMGWISSLYIAALRAGGAMAAEMGDAEFAAKCARIAELGSRRLVETLFNGEYLIHIPDQKRSDLTNTNKGCHIDQTMGQAFAFQVGLPRVIPRKESLSCLESIWKYNFSPDCGGFRKLSKVKGGRWYAMEGEAGVLMTTFPKGGSAKSTAKGRFAHYFNEVWTGQEYQLAGHMFSEGMVEKALAVVKCIHDRHAAGRRNPYNEIECGDHYSRAMSSYGAYLAACGFEYHGPKGHIGFAPKLTPDNFKCAFTASQGWGTYSQKAGTGGMTAEIAVKWGALKLRSLSLAMSEGNRPGVVKVDVGGKSVANKSQVKDGRLVIAMDSDIVLKAGENMEISV